MSKKVYSKVLQVTENNMQRKYSNNNNNNNINDLYSANSSELLTSAFKSRSLTSVKLLKLIASLIVITIQEALLQSRNMHINFFVQNCCWYMF